MSRAYFMDTNIFLRFLTRDSEEKAQACFRLFQQAQAGEIHLTTSEAVIAEVVYVLQRQYRVSRGEITQRLQPLLEMKNVQLSYRGVYLRALSLYRQHAVDFEDCLTVAHLERQQHPGLYSYDRDFDRFEQVTRLEPEAAAQRVIEESS